MALTADQVARVRRGLASGEKLVSIARSARISYSSIKRLSAKLRQGEEVHLKPGRKWDAEARAGLQRGWTDS